MKFLYLILLMMIAGIGTVSATVHNVTNSGFSFSPADLSINAGDTVVFSLASIHNVVEVSQSTWDADGTTPLAGGFSLPMGGGTIVLTGVGTHYYVCQPHASLGMKGTITVNSATGVVPGNNSIPDSYALDPAYPNPFNPTTSIRYDLPAESRVVLRLYNLLGQQVATLVDGIQAAGVKSAEWNAAGQANGLYFVRLDAGSIADPARSFSAIGKIILIK